MSSTQGGLAGLLARQPAWFAISSGKDGGEELVSFLGPPGPGARPAASSRILGSHSVDEGGEGGEDGGDGLAASLSPADSPSDLGAGLFLPPPVPAAPSDAYGYSGHVPEHAMGHSPAPIGTASTSITPASSTSSVGHGGHGGGFGSGMTHEDGDRVMGIHRTGAGGARERGYYYPDPAFSRGGEASVSSAFVRPTPVQFSYQPSGSTALGGAPAPQWRAGPTSEGPYPTSPARGMKGPEPELPPLRPLAGSAMSQQSPVCDGADAPVSRCLHIGNVPASMSEPELLEVLRTHGRVETMKCAPPPLPPTLPLLCCCYLALKAPPLYARARVVCASQIA